MQTIRRNFASRRREPWIDERIPGWMTKSELELIARAAAAVPKDGVIIEIGSFAGRSSVHWAANSDRSVVGAGEKLTPLRRLRIDPPEAVAKASGVA